MTNLELLKEAEKARLKAYTPYSHFQVGAVLETRDGKLYYGANIENASYGATNCAERTAFFKAINEGEREFSRIAIAGGPEGSRPDSSCAPCGICRQVMREFCGNDFKIFLSKGDGTYLETTLAEMLPFSFSSEDLNH